jgi:septal ring factor EnvC (AmiA/AmiB activator)
MEVSIMTGTTHQASTPPPDLPDPRFYIDFTAATRFGDVPPDVAALEADIAEIAEERDAARRELEMAVEERSALMRQTAEGNAREGELGGHIAGLRTLLGDTEQQTSRLLAVLARTVRAVMEGAADPLAEAIDALDAAGVLVPEAAPDRRVRHLAVAA